jgi:hypothetical protein
MATAQWVCWTAGGDAGVQVIGELPGEHRAVCDVEIVDRAPFSQRGDKRGIFAFECFQGRAPSQARDDPAQSRLCMLQSRS